MHVTSSPAVTLLNVSLKLQKSKLKITFSKTLRKICMLLLGFAGFDDAIIVS